MPRKDIEAAESEVVSLSERVAALGAGLSNRDALVAPVTGVIASSNAVAGQVVDARELVFEVIDPTACALRHWPMTQKWPAMSRAPRWPSVRERVPLAFRRRGAQLARAGAADAVPRRRSSTCPNWPWASP